MHGLVAHVLLEGDLGLHRPLLEARADRLAQEVLRLVDDDERAGR